MSLEGYDRSLISRALIVLVLIFSILFYILNYDKGGPLNIKNLHGTGSIDTWLRVVFRLSCAYLAIHGLVLDGSKSSSWNHGRSLQREPGIESILQRVLRS